MNSDDNTLFNNEDPLVDVVFVSAHLYQGFADIQ
jgi:hypothetical protein